MGFTFFRTLVGGDGGPASLSGLVDRVPLDMPEIVDSLDVRIEDSDGVLGGSAGGSCWKDAFLTGTGGACDGDGDSEGDADFAPEKVFGFGFGGGGFWPVLVMVGGGRISLPRIIISSLRSGHWEVTRVKRQSVWKGRGQHSFQ